MLDCGDQPTLTGLLALDGLINSLPAFTMSTVVLAPSGMTADAPVGVADDEAARLRYFEDSARRLTRYYALLGFSVYKADKVSKDTPELLGMWTGFVQPAIESIVPHLF